MRFSKIKFMKWCKPENLESNLKWINDCDGKEVTIFDNGYKEVVVGNSHYGMINDWCEVD